MSEFSESVEKLESLVNKLRNNESALWPIEMCDTILNPNAQIESFEIKVHVVNKTTFLDNNYTLVFPYLSEDKITATEKTILFALVKEYRNKVFAALSDRIKGTIEEVKMAEDQLKLTLKQLQKLEK